MQDYLDRHKHRNITKLFEIIHDYAKSDRGRRRQIDATNTLKKQETQPGTTRQWQHEQPQTAPRTIHNVSSKPSAFKDPARTLSGCSGRSNHGRGGRCRGSPRPRPFYCSFHGPDKGHNMKVCKEDQQAKKHFEKGQQRAQFRCR